MNASRPDKERITQLESALAHAQYELEQLNSVIVEQGKQLDQFGRRVSRLEELVKRLATRVPESAEAMDPAEEKPPHY